MKGTRLGSILSLLRARPARTVVALSHPATIAQAQIVPVISSLRRLKVPNTRWTSSDWQSAAPWLHPRDRARLAFIQMGIHFRVDALESVVTRIRECHPDVRVVFLDWHAPLHIKHPGVLPLVDVYVKKQVLADPTPYFEGMNDTNLIEYESGWNPAFADVERLVVDPLVFKQKVVVGWNFATHPPLIRMLLSGFTPPGHRPLSIHCRMAAPTDRDSWYSHMRGRAFDAVSHLRDVLGAGHHVLAERKRLDPKEYFAELRRSRMCFSPFGYGEVCWRDFEAIACGAVLVKPDMGHIRTDPDIYIPHETYIPVRWDFADLGEACKRYVDDPGELARVSQNAAEAWKAFLRVGWPKAWGRVMERTGLDFGTPPPLI